MLADPARLEQVVGNLLDNALKYTAPGGEVRVSTEQVDDHALLRVRDTGEGIRGELGDRVFELFVQEPQALDRTRGGLGLGLALVKQLVELHGGFVSVTSRGVGHGSEFTVQLPVHVGLSSRPRPASSLAIPPPAAGAGCSSWKTTPTRAKVSACSSRTLDTRSRRPRTL